MDKKRLTVHCQPHDIVALHYGFNKTPGLDILRHKNRTVMELEMDQ